MKTYLVLFCRRRDERAAESEPPSAAARARAPGDAPGSSEGAAPCTWALVRLIPPHALDLRGSGKSAAGGEGRGFNNAPLLGAEARAHEQMIAGLFLGLAWLASSARGANPGEKRGGLACRASPVERFP